MTAQANPELGRTLVIDGVSTNFHEAGEGEPLLLLHGSGPGVSAWANWRLNLPELARRFRVVAPDLLGFGYTGPAPEGRYGLDGWLRHLLGLLDALALPRVHVVGNSFGGALALALAVRHPERVGRLVLMGSVGLPFPITPGLDQVWGYTPSVANMRALLDLFAFDRGRVTDELAELRYRASIRPGVQENFAAMFPAPRQQWVDALAQPEAALAALPHETLILHGREDRVIPPASSERLFHLIPHAQLHLFGECGHWTQIEHAGRFNRLVGDFLAE